VSRKTIPCCGGRRANIRALVACLCSLVLFFALSLIASRAAAAAPPEPITELRTAAFVAPPSTGPTETVALPHLWRYDGKSPSFATYRLAFTAPVSAASLAVYIAGTNLPFEASVNGERVHEGGGPDSRPIPLGSWRATPSFRIPAEILAAGRNELELKVFANAAGLYALAPVTVGSADRIAKIEHREWLLKNLLPLAIAAVLAAVGVIALALWRGRRDFALFFWLGAGATLWSLQNFILQLPFALLPQPYLRVLIISLYVWFPLLLANFFLRFAYQRSVLFERTTIAVMLLAAPAVYVAESLRRFEIASIGLRALTLLFISIALLAVLRFALRSRDVKGNLLLAAGTLCVGGAMYDFIVSLLVAELRPTFLTTYAGAVLVLLTAWMLLDRYQQAYTAYRDLNRQLEQRVQAANTELQQRLAQTQAAREQAEQANVAKSRFFAAASHDLRQPLHSLGLFASALSAEVTSAKARELTCSIGDSIGVLEELFNELLDLSRLDAGIVPVQLRNIELQVLFDRLAREFHMNAVERDLRLRFVPTRLVVHTDAVLLERILTNLVANALRYTQQGGVVVGARRRGPRVAIEVCDTGVGIAPDKQSLVFEEFYQVDNPGRDRRRGLGLGLAIVKRLSRLLDLPVSLRSTPGHGTCFRVELPRSHEPADPLTALPEMVEDDALRDLRVLIVDDDVMVRQGTAAILRQWNADVRAAASAQDANRAIDDGFVPQLLIVDLRLGEVHDGVDVIETLQHRLRPNPPALLISGDTGAGELARVRDSGIPMLTKPVAPAKLRSMLRALLQQTSGATAADLNTSLAAAADTDRN
jgi:signal transduction histidine kinase/FixJ family two-component response regulator